MKKNTFSKIITAVSVLVLLLAVSAVFEPAFAEDTVNTYGMDFKHSDGTDAFSFSANESLTASCEVKNDSEPKRLNLYIAMYESYNDAGRLVGVTRSYKDFAANETATVTGTFDVPQTVDDGCYIKAFLFGDDLMPYADCQKISLRSEEDIYFTETPSVYRYYTPGIIRPDEGTIQFTVCPDRPSSELGNDYNMLFRIASAADDKNASNSVLALCLPRLEETRQEQTIQFVLKTRSGAWYLEKPFAYDEAAVGMKFNIAVSWKAGGNMYMYVATDDAVSYIGGIDCPAGLDEDTLSYFMSVDREGPMHVSDMMISSKQLYSGQISKVGKFKVDRYTTLLATDGLTKTVTNKSDWNTSTLYNKTVPAFRTEKQVYYEGEDVVYPVMSINHSGSNKVHTVDISVSDVDGNALFTKTATINVESDSKYHINEIPIRGIKASGLYKVHTKITDASGGYKEYDSNISVIPVILGEDGALSTYYGHHISYDSDVSVYKKLNVTSSRMWLGNFIWYSLEPTKNNWQWKKMDDYVDSLESEGIDMIGVLGYPSRWAATEPTAEDYTGKNGNALTWEYRPGRWKPKSYEEWENYVYTVVDRYKGRIKYWEVYNEVNFHPPYHTAAFSGSTEEYAELLRIAYSAAKRADPGCQILISGFSAPSGAVDCDMPIEFTKSKYQTGYFDIYNVHGYSGASSVASWLTAYRTARPGIKAFMTEEFPYQQGSDDSRAYASVRLPLEFLAAGYDRYYHFAMFGQEGVYTVPHTDSPTKAYQAVGVLQANLRKCNSYNTSAGSFTNSGLLNVSYSLTRTDGKKLYIFGASDEPFGIYLRGNIFACTDIYGRTLDVEEQSDGSYRVVCENIMYIVTDSSAQIVRAEDNTRAIVKNGGFEYLDGDVAAVGLSNCTPTNWVLKKLNAQSANDNSAGSIKLSGSVHNSGKYSLWLRTNVNGARVYACQNIDISEAGTYKFTAKIRKNADNGGLTPYMFYIDGDTGTYTPTMLNIEGTGFISQSVIITVAAPTKKKATVGLGIYSGLGEIYIDDISVEKLSDVVDIGALVTNPGFEILDNKVPTGWDIVKINTLTGATGGNVSTAVSSGTKNSGSYSLWIRTNEVNARGYAAQNITIPAAGTYRLSVKVCRRNNVDSLRPYIFFTNNSTCVTENTFLNIDSSVNNYTFTDQAAEFTVNGEVDATVGIGIYSGQGEIYIDDIEIEKIDD